MSLEKAEEYLKNKGMLDHVIRGSGRGAGNDREDHVVSSG